LLLLLTPTMPAPKTGFAGSFEPDVELLAAVLDELV
jgi:hypothetical protein